MVLHNSNWSFHYSTATEEVQRTIVRFLMVQATEMPTKVLPAPHGNTIMPERARELENIFESANSW